MKMKTVDDLNNKKVLEQYNKVVGELQKLLQSIKDETSTSHNDFYHDLQSILRQDFTGILPAEFLGEKGSIAYIPKHADFYLISDEISLQKMIEVVLDENSVSTVNYSSRYIDRGVEYIGKNVKNITFKGNKELVDYLCNEVLPSLDWGDCIIDDEKELFVISVLEKALQKLNDKEEFAKCFVSEVLQKVIQHQPTPDALMQYTSRKSF